MRTGGLALVFVAGTTLGSCAPSDAAVPETVIRGAVTAVPPEGPGGEVLLGAPVALSIDPLGSVHVLDQMLAHVVRRDQDGTITLLGGAGSGPGEFVLPMSLFADRDSIRIDDRGNRRIQVFSRDGRLARSYAVPVRGSARGAFGAGGRFIFETEGAGGSLAMVLDDEGRPLHSVGAAPVVASPVWNFRQIKEEIRRGRVPAVLRNAVRPALAADGTSWLVLTAEARVERHERGAAPSTAPLDGPESREIEREFFARNRSEPSPSAFYPLSFAADAVAVGDELWVLLQRPDDAASVVVVYGREGAATARWIFPDVPGARRLAPDPTSGRLYFALPSAASVVYAEIPPAHAR